MLESRPEDVLVKHVKTVEIVETVETVENGAICISCKIVHQMAPLASVENLATRRRHLR